MAETVAEENKSKVAAAEIPSDEKPAIEESKTEELKPAQTETNEESTQESEKVETEEKNEESDGESSEEELGSLEKPVEILTRKRDRKSVERLSLNTSEVKKELPEDSVDYTKGPGVKLGDIPYVKHMIDRALSDDLKPLSKLLYNKTIKTTILKREIRQFCGYPFDEDSVCYKRVVGVCDRFMMPGLKYVSGILSLEKSGDRETLKTRLMEFLRKPVDNNKTIPGSTKKSKKKKTPSKKKSDKPAKKSKESVGSEDVSEASDDSDAESKVEKKKTPKKSPKESPKKKIKKPTMAVKIAAPKKKTPKKEGKRAKPEVSDNDSDNDDAPLVKKVKKEPSDQELTKIIKEILKDADLEQVTMKTVCKQVYDRFPDFDLTHRKDFIKTTVKETIS